MNENKFDGMGKLYAKFRPTYPKSFIDHLYQNVGANPNCTIADIGSGTGIFSKLMLERGNKVFCVEPNDDMRSAAMGDLAHFDGFVSVSAPAENTTLDAHSVDFITVAQAFHWFDRVAFKAECKRILKPCGKVILVWNSRDKDSDFVKEYDVISKQFCPNFKGFSNGMRGDDDDFSSFFTGAYEALTWENNQTTDIDGFIGRTLSSSYALKENDENFTAYVAALESLFQKYCIGDTVVMPNYTNSYIGSV